MRFRGPIVTGHGLLALGDRDKACEHYVGAAARFDERNSSDQVSSRDEAETLIGAEALIRYCTDRLATDPDSPNLLLARATARARSGQLDQAAEDYAQALRLLPEPTNPWWHPIAGGISPMVELDEVYERLVRRCGRSIVGCGSPVYPILRRARSGTR